MPRTYYAPSLAVNSNRPEDGKPFTRIRMLFCYFITDLPRIYLSKHCDTSLRQVECAPATRPAPPVVCGALASHQWILGETVPSS
jgi:hypothetical protein